MEHLDQRQLIQYGITAVIVLVVWFFRIRGMAKSRPLKLEQLWIVPVIFTVIAALAMVQTPPLMSDAPWLIAALAVGCVIGWYRGKMMRITVDPETHALNQTASPAAIILLIAIFAVRYAIRFFLAEEAQAWNISLNLLADAPLLIVVGMFVVARIEMYLRAQKLLTQARAARAAGATGQAS